MYWKEGKKASSKVGVYKFLVFSDIIPHSFNLLIVNYADNGFQLHWVDWWCLRKVSVQLRAGICWKSEICKLQIWSSLFWPGKRGFGFENTSFNYLHINGFIEDKNIFWIKISWTSVTYCSKRWKRNFHSRWQQVRIVVFNYSFHF